MPKTHILRRWFLLLIPILILSTIASANSAKKTAFDSWQPFSASAVGAAPTTINVNDIFNLTNTGGSIVYNPTTQTLSFTSTITTIYSDRNSVTGDLGTITFTSGALVAGNVFGFATFAAGSGEITLNGTDGLPNGPFLALGGDVVHWHEIGNTSTYYFHTGSTTEYATRVPGSDTFNITSGATVIPEPSSLVLAVSGLLGLIAMRARWR